MKRNKISFSFAENERRLIKNKMLNWLRPFSIFSYMDNNGYLHEPCRYEMLAGCNAIRISHSPDIPAGDWWLGHISYDYKNQIEPKLNSLHNDPVGFTDVMFFIPETIVYIRANEYTLHIETLKDDAGNVLKEILETTDSIGNTCAPAKPQWKYRFTKEQYIKTVEQIRAHIKAGDCYELNFCTEAFAETVTIDPVFQFHRLNALNPSPFAALYRNDDKWLLCASPERFIYREKETLISQPIKGTARRSRDAEADDALKHALLHNKK